MAKDASLLISQLNIGGVSRWIHDASSLHGITPNTSTYTLQIGDPGSAYSTTAVLALPSEVALKSDISQVLVYKGTVSSANDLPGNASTGWVYVSNANFKYNNSSIEPGDMFVRNQSTEEPKYDVIQTNIDPAKYAVKGHTHTVTVSGTTAETSIKPEGSVSVTVSGATTTFTGSYTPAGSVTVGTFTFDSTAATVSTTSLTVSDSGHSHSFTGTAATISLTYKKAAANTGNAQPTVSGSITASYTPAGTIAATLSSSSASVNIVGGKFTSHSHSFNGSLTTFSGNYTPAGTISKPEINMTLTSASVTYASGNRTLSSTAFTSQSVLKSAVYTTSSETLTIDTADVAKFESGAKYLTDVTLATTTFTNLTGVTGALAAAPTFTGEAAAIKVSGTPLGTIGATSGSVTGSISYNNVTAVNAEFIGTAGNPTIAFTLSAANHSHSIGSTDTTITTSYTPEGTIGSASANVALGGNITVNYDKLSTAQGKFSGTAATITVSGTPKIESATATFTGTTFTHSHTYSTTTTSGTDA